MDEAITAPLVIRPAASAIDRLATLARWSILEDPDGNRFALAPYGQ